MTLQQLKYFKEVVKTKSFSRAAENMNIAQPSLSYSINELEKELGVPLLVRDNKKSLDLTKYGEAFLEYVDSALSILNSGVDKINSLADPSSGRVSVAYPYVVGQDICTLIFRDFIKDSSHKGIELHFDSIRSEEQIALGLQRGDHDVAFTARPYSTSGVMSSLIAIQKLYVYMSVEHPFAKAGSVSAKQLRSETLILGDKGAELTSHVNYIFESSRIKPANVMHVGRWEARMLYAAVGMGVSISPYMSHDNENIAVLELDDPHSTRPIYLTWPANRKLSPAAELVRDYCLEHHEEALVGKHSDISE